MAQTNFSGFCQIPPLKINGSLSPIGELTVKGFSYAKEPDYFYQDKEPCELVIFRGVAGSSQHEKIPSTHVNGVMTVCNWLYSQALAGKTNSNSVTALQLLSTQFSNGYKFNSVGVMVTNSTIWLPSHIDFTYTVNDVVHEFKIWFAIDNFINEFPYRDIYVIGPVPPEEIDSLLDLNYKDLQKRLAEETTSRIENRIYKLIGESKYPYTARLVYTYDIYDVINKPYTTKADWTIIIYGNPANADDEINEAIKDCILKNTKHPESEWENGIPDLFNPLEFFVVPHWEDKGLENETTSGSTYSPVYAPLNGDNLALKYADFYEESFIKSSHQVVPHQWKSIKMSIVGKPKNNLGQTTFLSVYKDYQLIPSTDSQLEMVSPETDKFIVDIETLLSVAEVSNPDSITIAGINKVTRKERLYFTKKIGKVKFTCISRYQFIKDGIIKDD